MDMTKYIETAPGEFHVRALTATIRSTGTGKFYISCSNGTRRRQEYKTVAGAQRAANQIGYASVTVDPGADASLTSIAHLCSFHQAGTITTITVELDKYGPNQQAIMFHSEDPARDAVAIANEFLPKLGWKPVRVTRNILNSNSGPIVIDADTPSYMDVGSESYHSM